MKKLNILGKRGLSLFTALMMCMSMLPISALASEGEPSAEPAAATEPAAENNDTEVSAETSDAEESSSSEDTQSSDAGEDDSSEEDSSEDVGSTTESEDTDVSEETDPSTEGEETEESNSPEDIDSAEENGDAEENNQETASSAENQDAADTTESTEDATAAEGQPAEGTQVPEDGSQPSEDTQAPEDGSQPAEGTQAPEDGSQPSEDAPMPEEGEADKLADIVVSTDEGEFNREVAQLNELISLLSEDDFDITQTERPGMSGDISFSKGDKDDKLHLSNNSWDVFYDPDRDVYKITFNIDETAEDRTQVIDLTYALELLQLYADTGKRELEKQQALIEKPVKEPEPVKGDIGMEEPVEPDKPVAPDAPQKPEKPVAPIEPGKPEGLDQNLADAYQEYVKSVSRDEDGEPADTRDNIKAILVEKTGLPADDAFVVEYADYMYDQAMVDWVMDSWSTWERTGHIYVNYFGDPDTMLYYGCGINANFKDGKPTMTGPEYEVDKNSEAYKNYEAALQTYEDECAAYESKLEAYRAAQQEYEEKYGVDSPAYQAYLAEMAEYQKQLEAYEQVKAKVEADYQAALADYEARKDEIEKKYADDTAAYEAKLAELKAEFDQRIGANILEPGDSKKFELSLTSDSKHTYRYKEGSFTLATPDWGTGVDGVIGFDGQSLPEEYVDTSQYYVTVYSEPIQKLLENTGLLDPDHPYNSNGISTMVNASKNYIQSYPHYWDSKIVEYLNDYLGEAAQEMSLSDKVNAYLLSYYNKKDGTSYESLDALIWNNAIARRELTKTTTDGNREFNLSDQKFEIMAHTPTLKYDTFYKQLFSFAFGDEEDIQKILGEGRFNEGTNRWEYENKSWTNNGLQNALFYYMNHEEIWHKTDTYFKNLLQSGLNAEDATWTSLMMALNIDGELTGNTWQDTKWPWYSSITLERLDYDFLLNKTSTVLDENGNPLLDKDGNQVHENIKSTETTFEIWYEDENGKKQYLKLGENGEFEFVDTYSTVNTDENGQLKIPYALRYDKNVFIQEVVSPTGYLVDPQVYVLPGEYDAAIDDIDFKLKWATGENKTKLEAEKAALEMQRDAWMKGINEIFQRQAAETQKALEAERDEILSKSENAEFKKLYEQAEALEERINGYLEENNKNPQNPPMDKNTYVEKLKTQLNSLTVSSISPLSYAELRTELKKHLSTVQGLVDSFNAKKDELENLRTQTEADINSLNAQLTSELDRFESLKLRLEASKDSEERKNLYAQITEIQKRADEIKSSIEAKQSKYSESAMRSELEIRKNAANAAMSEYNRYKTAFDSVMASREFQDLKSKYDTFVAYKNTDTEMRKLGEIYNTISILKNKIISAHEGTVLNLYEVKNLSQTLFPRREETLRYETGDLSDQVGNPGEISGNPGSVGGLLANLSERYKGFADYINRYNDRHNGDSDSSGSGNDGSDSSGSGDSEFGDGGFGNGGFGFDNPNLDFDFGDDFPIFNIDFDDISTPTRPIPDYNFDDDDDDEPDEPDTPEELTPEIPEEPTPLTDIPEEDIPLEDMSDEDVPLADMPEEELTEIPEDMVPLADAPLTGDGFNGLAVMSLLGMCGLMLLKSKKDEI